MLDFTETAALAVPQSIPTDSSEPIGESDGPDGISCWKSSI